MELVIIRGLPGSGKSTMAKSMTGHAHFEADMAFCDEFGVYHFDHARLSDAHAWCLMQCRKALAAGKDVVVSNTFTRRWEYSPYLEAAHEFGADVKVIVATGNFKNVHGVPEEKIEAMRKRWQD